MTNSTQDRRSERGAVGIKVLLIFLVLFLAGNAGYHYIPVAYDGANFRQEMDTAVVKGLAASGQMKPLDVVKASVARAASQNNVPADALIDIKPENGGTIIASVAYSKKVGMLPFGLYDYVYKFDYTARPTGYLLK
ncbi:MAG: hypothetical protein ABI791_11325 [Acidobacteriota bacterium]